MKIASTSGVSIERLMAGEGERPASGPQLAELIAIFYSGLRRQFLSFQRHTSSNREEILEAIRQLNGITTRPDFFGTCGSETDLEVELAALSRRLREDNN